MAVIKLNTTDKVAPSLDYAESRAVERSGLNCDVDYAKEQFLKIRQLWNKNDGIQGHTVIQSFLPGEVDAKQANEIGQRLAEKLADGYAVAIFTHADKHHIHNHIVINSVHPETGKKYHCHNGIGRVRDASDELCREYGLSIAHERPSRVRHTLAEQHLLQKGADSWKDEIRQAIDASVRQSSNYDKFKQTMNDEYGISIKDSGKYISFTHPDSTPAKKLVSRGHKLGDDYTKEGIIHGIERQISQKREADERWELLNQIRDTNSVISEHERERHRLEHERVRSDSATTESSEHASSGSGTQTDPPRPTVEEYTIQGIDFIRLAEEIEDADLRATRPERAVAERKERERLAEEERRRDAQRTREAERTRQQSVTVYTATDTQSRDVGRSGGKRARSRSGDERG